MFKYVFCKARTLIFILKLPQKIQIEAKAI